MVNPKPVFQSAQENWVVYGVEGSWKLKQSKCRDFAIIQRWQDLAMNPADN